MKPTVIAVLPAYNARKTLAGILRRIPEGIFDEILLVDDGSRDGTFAYAKQFDRLTVYRTPRNMGYGGNLKLCLYTALLHNADVIVELHPDGEYGVDGIIPALAEVQKGAAFVLGNRFADPFRPHPDGMRTAKYLVTRVLTGVCNLIVGTKIPDMHQGFRVYTKQLLQRINVRAAHDDFLFSFDVICQAVLAGFEPVSIPVTAVYRGNKRGASWLHSIRYTVGTLGVLIQVIRKRLGHDVHVFSPPPANPGICPVCGSGAFSDGIYRSGKYTVYVCRSCESGYTRPLPETLRSYYPKTYYNLPGTVGRVKELVFRFAQMRRVRWVQSDLKHAEVLDVGCGNGRFGTALSGGGYRVTGIDPFFDGATSTSIRREFLAWSPTRTFDAIVFWESLEHVSDPGRYLAKAVSLLHNGGFVYIEYPRFHALEARIFGRDWFHLDIPRHCTHFSDSGLRLIAQQHGLNVRVQKSVYASEYAPAGLLMSMLRVFHLEQQWIWFSPLLLICLPLSALLYLFGQSPIGLLVAVKADTMRSRV